jgi:hypothetical protein
MHGLATHLPHRLQDEAARSTRPFWLILGKVLASVLVLHPISPPRVVNVSLPAGISGCRMTQSGPDGARGVGGDRQRVLPTLNRRSMAASER